MAFSDNLKSLASVQHIARLDLMDSTGINAGSIENKPGQQGSLAVYHHLLVKHGAINASAAAEGLTLYAEHTEDARRNPGKHPNIDRLLRVAEAGGRLSGKISPAAT